MAAVRTCGLVAASPFLMCSMNGLMLILGGGGGDREKDTKEWKIKSKLNLKDKITHTLDHTRLEPAHSQEAESLEAGTHPF